MLYNAMHVTLNCCGKDIHYTSSAAYFGDVTDANKQSEEAEYVTELLNTIVMIFSLLQSTVTS